MRIVAGRFRGHTLQAPKGSITRPTSDRVREAVFSSLEHRYDKIDGARVLDLFAGSGALGLEALSRGAEHVTFVETSRSSRQVLARNVAALDVGPQVLIRAGDAFRIAPSMLTGGPFALLFLDPPYRIEPAQVRELLEGLACQDLLEPGAVIVYEHRTGTDPVWPEGFEGEDDRVYGETTVSYGVFMAEEEFTE